MERKFGCKRSKYDPRDKKYLELEGVNSLVSLALPPSVDLRSKCPPVYDQGALGSCTANAIAFVCEYAKMKNKAHAEWTPARLFVYYNERVIEGTVDQDSGASLRDGIQTIHTLGFPKETLWPYDISKFAIKPTPNVYSAAAVEKVAVKDYGAVNQDITTMKTALANGHPIVIGFIVYASFMTQQVGETGIVPMPGPNEQVMGGHAVAIVGYNDQGWIVRNSWGSGWGQQGYFIMPYAYFTNPQLAWDLWVVRVVP